MLLARRIIPTISPSPLLLRKAMRNKYSIILICGAACAAALAGLATVRAVGTAQADPRLAREELYRLNNIGAAYLEQFKPEEAAKHFAQAVAKDAAFAIGHVNLAIAHYFNRDMARAAESARAAIKLNPKSPHAHYVLGAVLKNEKQYDAALAAFNQVLAADPKDAYANIQIGQIHSLKQQYEPAVTAFRRALEAEPYNATAAYSLATALNRSGKAAGGKQMFDLFNKLRASGYATTLGLNYGEQGRYAEAVISTGAEPDLVSKEAPSVKFVDATREAGLNVKFANKPLSTTLNRKLTKAEFEQETTKQDLVSPFSSSIGLPDYDGDNKFDLFVTGVDAAGKPFAQLFHNDGGKFSDVTVKSGIKLGGPASGAVFGDFDNDGKQDLFVFGYRTLALFKGNGDGTFADVTASAALPADNGGAWALTATFVDADHDGDLDVFVGNFADLGKWPGGESAMFPDDFAGAPNKLFRNDGNGKFTDITDKAGLGGGNNKTTAVVCTDFNNQRDIDFFVVNYGAPAQLFSNQRDGSFKEVAEQVGIRDSLKTLSVAAGDFNKDSFTDFYIANLEGEQRATYWVYLSDGRGGFGKDRTSLIDGLPHVAKMAQAVDYDNDGVLDVLSFSKDHLEIHGNVGVRGGRRSVYSLVSEVKDGPVSELKPADSRAVATGDFNGDGAVDSLTITSDGRLVALRNESASNNYVRLALEGKSSNKSGIGTKAEVRSGSLAQKLELYASSPAPAAAGLTFGLGYRTKVDALKLTWPAGIVQSELDIKTSTVNALPELDRKGTSCPILYAWDGSGYSFVTDFLGGSAIGFRLPDGSWNYPDTDEYVRVTGEQLKERSGVYSILMNNQLEEVIFFDAVKLLAVDHPAETDVYPNERLMPAPPYPAFKIYSVKAPRPPVAAVDDRGKDILPLISQVDRRYPDDFELLRFKGYAKEHTIELDLGKDAVNAKRTLLLLTAWIDYADSTANLAASQAGAKLIPPYVQVKNKQGEWETVIEQMGFPAGLPKTMTVDLTGKFLCQDSRVRIVTSMRLYWDQILVDTSGGEFPARVTTLEAMRAELRWRGFPREYSPDGHKPLVYDYRTIEPFAPWKAHLGTYTRFGDVRELLVAPDDMYVITRNGDEMQVDFDAGRLPPLPAGWKRDFLVFADGFGKDMDLNSARPETVGELPYHGMKSYPYSPGDKYPDSERHREYHRKYNTRTVGVQAEAQWRGVR
jgi:tetratricopeptide (TPR) repeat protein